MPTIETLRYSPVSEHVSRTDNVERIVAMAHRVGIARPPKMVEALMSHNVGTVPIPRSILHAHVAVPRKDASSNDAVHAYSVHTPKVESVKNSSWSNAISREAISPGSAHPRSSQTVTVDPHRPTIAASDRPSSRNNIGVRPNHSNWNNALARTKKSRYIKSPVNDIPPYRPPSSRPPAGPLIRLHRP